MYRTLEKLFAGRGFSKYPLYRAARKAYLRFLKGNVIEVNGYKMKIPYENCADYDGRFHSGKVFEEEIVERLKKEVRENAVCVDIGASAGYYALLFASLAPRGRVLAIEPSETANLLKGNIQLNGFLNVTAVQGALSDKIEGMSLPADWSEPAQKGTEFISYPLNQKADEADFIQMDVAGSEPKVYRGMKGMRIGTLITTFWPDLIRKTGEDPEQFMRELEKNFQVEVIPINKSYSKLWCRIRS